eukprot:403348085
MKLITTWTISLTLFAIATFAQDDCVPIPYCGEIIGASEECKVNCDCYYPDEFCNSNGQCEKDESLYNDNGQPILLPLINEIYCDLIKRPKQNCATACDCLYQDTECREDGLCYVTKEFPADTCNS